MERIEFFRDRKKTEPVLMKFLNGAGAMKQFSTSE